MIERRFRRLWQQLQGKKPRLPHFLSEIHLQGIRGIDDLRVAFDYPVSVIAGGNATGKSTVLFAAACAYKVPGAGVKDFVPSTLFPDYRPGLGGREDEKPEIVLEFDYATPDGRRAMRWRRSKGWNRSFLGRKKASQPERPLYLRTLSNLSNPSEVRSVLRMSHLRIAPRETPLTASQIAFAQRMLSPFRYSEVVDLSSNGKRLLFAAREGGAAYSELHMAAGERAILHLSREIAQLRGALVLIDEVEAGLHPWVQQLLMLELQQLALRNDLQILVTSHSPVVLDSVPPNGRIFLERDEAGRVTMGQPHRDVVQNALYGRTGESLNLLCEDEAAEGLLRGVFDVLAPRLALKTESLRIGRDTGAGEFPQHAAALRKFSKAESFVFVLDGDQRAGTLEGRIRESAGSDVPVLFLPGPGAPEIWVWDRLRNTGAGAAAEEPGIGADDLPERLRRLDSVYDSASDRPGEIAKAKLRELAETLNRSASDLCRIVARLEARREESDVQLLVESLETAVLQWRAA